MIKKTKEVLKKLEFGILELLLGILIVIGIIGYFHQSIADLDWIDHTVSFILFSYLFYKINITSILFGKTNKTANLAIVISFYSLFFKNVFAYTEETAFQFVFLKFIDAFYLYLRSNFFAVIVTTFHIGIIGLAVVAISLTRNMKVSKPSLLYALTHRTPTKKSFIKFLIVFVSLLGFYYFVYNTLLEWLEFTLDDPIIMVGIAFFIFKLVKHKEKFHKDNFVFKIGDFTANAYSKFISLFHYKKTLPLAISGLIVLHALTDLGVFSYSLIFGVRSLYLEGIYKSSSLFGDEQYYIEQLANHRSFLNLFNVDLNFLPSSEIISLFLFVVYSLNALSLISFLAIPLIAWAKIFSNKSIHLSRALLPIVYSSITAYVLLPAYKIGSISSQFLVGADIQTKSILKGGLLSLFTGNEVVRLIIAVTISTSVGVVINSLSRKKSARKELFAFLIICGLAFYAVYIYHFFKSTAAYLIGQIYNFIFSPYFIVGLALLILLVLSFFFYIGGYFMLVYEIVMEYHKKKWSEPIDDEIVMFINKVKSISSINFKNK